MGGKNLKNCFIYSFQFSHKTGLRFIESKIQKKQD